MALWCSARGVEPGAVVSPEQCWDLAQRWYRGRADMDWRRRTPAETQAIFDASGLVGPFWSLTPR